MPNVSGTWSTSSSVPSYEYGTIYWEPIAPSIYKEPTLVERYKRKNIKVVGLVKFLEGLKK